MFAFIIMLRRHPGVHAFDESALAEIVEIRTTFFGRLEQELIRSSNGLLDQEKVKEFTINRNWLVHHLILDPRYVATSKTCVFDLSPLIAELEAGLKHFWSVYTELARRDGIMERLEGLVFTKEDMASLSRSVSLAIIKKKGWK